MQKQEMTRVFISPRLPRVPGNIWTKLIAKCRQNKLSQARQTACCYLLHLGPQGATGPSDEPVAKVKRKIKQIQRGSLCDCMWRRGGGVACWFGRCVRYQTQYFACLARSQLLLRTVCSVLNTILIFDILPRIGLLSRMSVCRAVCWLLRRHGRA